jgi:hypothetical protein
MTTLHTAPRPVRRESETRRDHVAVFREFLDHLDRASRQSAPPRTPRTANGEGARSKKIRHPPDVVPTARLRQGFDGLIPEPSKAKAKQENSGLIHRRLSSASW